MPAWPGRRDVRGRVGRVLGYQRTSSATNDPPSEASDDGSALDFEIILGMELSVKIRCGHCGNTAPMEVLCSINRAERFEDHGEEWDVGFFYELLECFSCRKLSFSEHPYTRGWIPKVSKVRSTFFILAGLTSRQDCQSEWRVHMTRPSR